MGEPEMKLLYQSYRLEALPWRIERTDLGPREFVDQMEQFLVDHYQWAWSIRDGRRPVLLVLGMETRDFVLIGDVVWTPTASPREKILAVVELLDSTRKEHALMLMSTMEHKKFYERMIDYGLLRRVGTFYTLDGQWMAEYQTRAK